MRLSSEARRKSAGVAARTAMTTKQQQRNPTVPVPPSDDEDIADLLISFSRAPTKQVSGPLGVEVLIERAHVPSAGVQKNQEDRKTFEVSFSHRRAKKGERPSASGGSWAHFFR